jgi:LuxR family quorum-sensing system transcriptional regulator CciR
MAGMADGTSFGLATCVSATDAMLRALAGVSAADQLAGLMSAITHEIGFRYFALIHHDDLRGEPRNRVKLLDYPAAIEDRLIGQGVWRRDPVIRGCIFAQGAFRWSELPDIIAMDRRDMESIAFGMRAGLNEGITVPYSILGECMGSCTFAGTRAPKRAKRYLGVAQMIGVFAFQAARRIQGCVRDMPAPRPRLHPRPRDCVILAGRGMSNKEIARTLSLAPRTVDSYMTEARELFGAHDRTELVVSAIFAGEIGLDELLARQPE